MKELNLTTKKLNRVQLWNLQHLEETLEPYKEHWEEWIKSPDCCITQREALILERYKEHCNLRLIGQELPEKISRERVRQLFVRTIRTLRSAKTKSKFDDWVEAGR